MIDADDFNVLDNSDNLGSEQKINYLILKLLTPISTSQASTQQVQIEKPKPALSPSRVVPSKTDESNDDDDSDSDVLMPESIPVNQDFWNLNSTVRKNVSIYNSSGKICYFNTVVQLFNADEDLAEHIKAIKQTTTNPNLNSILIKAYNTALGLTQYCLYDLPIQQFTTSDQEKENENLEDDVALKIYPEGKGTLDVIEYLNGLLEYIDTDYVANISIVDAINGGFSGNDVLTASPQINPVLKNGFIAEFFVPLTEHITKFSLQQSTAINFQYDNVTYNYELLGAIIRTGREDTVIDASYQEVNEATHFIFVGFHKASNAWYLYNEINAPYNVTLPEIDNKPGYLPRVLLYKRIK